MEGQNKLIIFDCDGVLVDSEILSVQVFQELFSELRIPFAEKTIFETFIGRSNKSCLALLDKILVERELSSIEFWDEFCKRQFAYFPIKLKAVTGVEKLLKQLVESNVDYCLASSGNPEKIKLTLGICGLTKYFENRIFSAVEVKHGKPAPDLFLLAASRMGFASKDCLVIEDSIPGVEAAVAADMDVIAYCERNSSENFKDIQTVESMSELTKLL